jgi:transposase
MMGERQTDHPALFYEFSLERHVPGDHLLRSIARFVDLGDIREQLRPFYSDTGRPSVDPELMIRMLIVGYCMGIRSERRLCEEVHLNLAYRWFCRLGLDGAVPDHSTFSKNRHGRFRESDLLRKLFESTVARCIAKGLVGGQGFAVDASMIKADANRQNSTPGDRWEPPDDPGHAVREYLAVLDEAAFGGATEVVPKFIATADPASRWTGANGGLAFFAYSDNYLIDLDHAVIVDVEATTSVRQAEVTAARRMIERTQARFGLWPERLAADAGYGEMRPTSLGSSRRRASSRTSPCSTSRRDATERSNEPTSSTIMPTTATSARAASACGNDGRCIANHARSSMRTA